MMELQKLREASEKIVAYIKGQLDCDGKLKDEELSKDLVTIYKLPLLLVLTGNSRLAHKMLNYIKDQFMQPNGDFLSYPSKKTGRKSSDPALAMHWAYVNGWIAMAAHRLGRFDVSYAAWGFIKQFYNPEIGGFCTSGRWDDDPSKADGPVMWSGGNKYDVGIFITSHLGLTALFLGDMEKARSSGDLIMRMVEEQPALDKYFLLHVNGETGKLVEDGPEEQRLFYRLLRNEPKELFFQLGYPVYFLHHLYQASMKIKYLDTGEKILNFLLTCHEGFYTFFFSHKVAWGAGLVAMVSGKEKYREMCGKVVEYLLSLQTSEGDMLRDLGPMSSLDQTAEIGVWLWQLASAMVDKDVL